MKGGQTPGAGGINNNTPDDYEDEHGNVFRYTRIDPNIYYIRVNKRGGFPVKDDPNIYFYDGGNQSYYYVIDKTLKVGTKKFKVGTEIVYVTKNLSEQTQKEQKDNEQPTGGKRRTRRRRQRSNKKRTNKRKKTKTRMKRRKTSKRNTNKRRRKR
jgi:hypothetical protein